MTGNQNLLSGALDGLTICGPARPGADTILTPDALAFVAELVRQFSPRRDALLAARVERQARLDAGEMPDFLPETADVRAGDWVVEPCPADLQDRRVEITGPVDRKMVINALNSGARVFMADFEDSNAPTWSNQIDGQVNLRDAVAGTITYEHPRKGTYRLHEETAVLMVRPRGLHLPEAHLLVDGAPAPGSLVDFGLFFFHNARALVAKGSGPYFYLPKLQHWTEAKWWDDVFVYAQERLGLPVGTVKATVLLEHVLAVFQMHEILHALRRHSAGLNCGRWDYIFSFIKTFRAHPDRIVPERGQVGMDRRFLRSYTELLIQTCHRRGAFAMGGMAAQIPIKNDPVANERALEKVRADKRREADAGHDGSWVAHPGLVGLAMDIFDERMTTPNQIHRQRPDVSVSAADLLALPEGTVTEAGVRVNINVGLLYTAAWLAGSGCVPLYNLMEDAATAEISRTQLWQWVRYGVSLEDGRVLSPELFTALIDEETSKIEGQGAGGSTLSAARDLFHQLTLADDLAEFLTLPAYQYITTVQE